MASAAGHIPALCTVPVRTSIRCVVVAENLSYDLFIFFFVQVLDVALQGLSIFFEYLASDFIDFLPQESITTTVVICSTELDCLLVRAFIYKLLVFLRVRIRQRLDLFDGCGLFCLVCADV